MSKFKMYFDDKDFTIEDFKKLQRDAARGIFEDGIDPVLGQKVASATIRDAMLFALDINKNDYKNGEVPLKVIKRAKRRNPSALYEIIEDTIDDQLTSGWNNSEWFDMFVDRRNLADGDDEQFYTEKEVYLTVNEMAGGHHDVSIQRLGEGETFRIKTTTYVVAVGGDIDLFLLGRRDWNVFINAVAKAYDNKIKDTMFAEVISVGAQLPANSQFNVSSPLSAATKDRFDEWLSDVSTANGDDEVIIMGTREAISKVAKISLIDWSENMKDELNKTGRVGYYEGRLLMEIPQRFKQGDPTNKLVATDILLAVPKTMDKFVKFVDKGDGEITEVTEKGVNMTDEQRYEYQRTLGVGTVIGKYFGNWQITS